MIRLRPTTLLDAAGYKAGADGIRAGTCDGKPVKFSLGLETTNAQRRVDDMAAIQADLKKIGIDIKPNPIPAGTFFGSYTEGADMPTRQVRYGDLHHRLLSGSGSGWQLPVRGRSEQGQPVG